MSSSIGDVINSGSGIGQLMSTLKKGHAHAHRSEDDHARQSGFVEKSNRFANAVFEALQQMGVPMDTPVASSSVASSTTSANSAAVAADPAPAQESAQDLGDVLKTFLTDLFDALQSVSNQVFARGAGMDGDEETGMLAGAFGEFHAKMRDGHSVDIKLGILIQQLSSGNDDSSMQNNGIFAALQQDFKNLLNICGAKGENATLPDFLKNIAENLRGGTHGLNIDAQA